MNHKTKWFVGFTTITFVGFIYAALPLPYTASTKQLLADQLRDDAAKKISSHEHLHLIGKGAQMFDKIEVLSLHFQCFNEVDRNSARQLLVYTSKTLIDEINSSEKIRPYLKNYPFTAENIEICIWFYKPNHSDVGDQNIKFAVNQEGKIEYYFGGANYDITKPSSTETYDMALKIIES